MINKKLVNYTNCHFRTIMNDFIKELTLTFWCRSYMTWVGSDSLDLTSQVFSVAQGGLANQINNAYQY